MYGHIIKFSGMGRFTYPWCFAGASFASARGPLIFENMKCNAYVCCSFMLNVFFLYENVYINEGKLSVSLAAIAGQPVTFAKTKSKLKC